MAFVLFSLFSASLHASAPGKPDSAYHLYLKALLLESQGNLTSAQEALEAALAMTPDSAFLNRTAAEMAFRLGQVTKALERVEKSIDLKPNEVKSLILAGQIYWARGENEKAEMKFKQAVALAPDEEEAIINLAGAVTPRDPRQAIKIYSSYLDRHPQPEIQERVAQLYQGLGEIESARKAWERALDWAPGSLRAHLALAQIAEIHYDTATAVSHYEAVLTQDPANLPLLLRIGELRYRSNDTTEASKAFLKARELAPDSPSANFWLALLAEQRGDWNEAIRLLKQVALKAPEPGVLLRLSYYCSQAGRYGDAIKILDQLVKMEPDNKDFLNYLAIAYEQNKQLPKAEKVLLRLQNLSPGDPDVHFHLATVYDRMKKFPKAEAELREAIHLKPDNHVAMNYLGYSYADRNINLDAAEKLINDAIALDPQNGAYMDSMGWTYYRQKKFGKAEDFLKQAAALANDPLILDHLGDAQIAQKKGVEALASWDKSLKLAPVQPETANKIKAAIKTLSPEERIKVFMRRAAAHFAQIDTIHGLAQVKVCQGKPCFETRANVSYEQGGELRAEVPGPLGAPVLLVTKSPGRPASYGSIHPIFKNAEHQVLSIVSRMEAVLMADIFHAENGRPLDEKIIERSGLTSLTRGKITFEFKTADGTLKRLLWKETREETLNVGVYGGSHGVLPAGFAWSATGDPVSVQFDFIKPVVSFVPDEDDPIKD